MRSADLLHPPTALARGLWRCLSCAAVFDAPPGSDQTHCPRCGARVRARRRDAIARSWAYLLAATVLYVPANLLPVTRTHSLTTDQSDTLFSGIAYLWSEGSPALALIVLVASIVVPLVKLLFLSYLLLSVQKRSLHSPQARLRMYRVLEAVGRWSMLDVYVVTLLVALVQIQAFAQIEPGPGAIAFSAVVVLTLLATHSFDPRLIWDETPP